MQVFLGIVVETTNLAELKRWATEKSLEAPIVRPLAHVTRQQNSAKSGIELNATAFRVFEYWRTRCNHPRAIPGDRIAKVKHRLREGFTEDQLRQAVDGAAISPTVNETTKKVYDDLELICRNASKVEDFMSRATTSKSNDQKRELAGRLR